MPQTTQKDTRTAEQIRAAIAETRARMAANVEGLVEGVHPQAVKQRTINEAKSYAKSEFASLKGQVAGQVKSEDGWRTDRLAIAGGAVLGLLTFVLTIRGIIRRAKKSR